VTTELAYATRNGPIDYEIRHIPEFDDKGTISSFLFIGRDISVQKRLQRQAAAQARDIHALTASLMTAQEQERRRVAREIHDSLLQHLGVLAAEIANAGSDLLDSSPVKKRLQAAREHALRTANEARQLSHQLHPAIVEDLGLRRALQSLCVKISEEHGVAVKFRVRGPLPSIPLDAASCAYRVAQEALNNVVKHARAKNIDVLLAGRRTLQLSIRDKGIGFDPVAVQGVGGLGLISMRERARLANGELSVDAKPGHGTLIKLVLRLPEGALGGKRGSGLQTPSRRSG
jgi:signal transduction histidine kinase